MSVSASILSPEDARTRARPLLWRLSSDGAAVVERLTAVVRSWREAWGIDPGERSDALDLRCVSAGEARAESAEVGWEELAGATGAWWTVVGRVRGVQGVALVRSELSFALFGEGDAPPSSAASEVLDSAWRDFLDRVCSSLAGPSATAAAPWPTTMSPGPALAPWSGALVARVPWWDARLELLLSAEAVERLVPAAPRPVLAAGQPIQQLWHALSNRALQLLVELEAFDVELGALASLHPGHVLGTTHGVDRPLRVMVRGQADARRSHLCSGLLGRLGDARAVALAESKLAEPVYSNTGG